MPEVDERGRSVVVQGRNPRGLRRNEAIGFTGWEKDSPGQGLNSNVPFEDRIYWLFESRRDERVERSEVRLARRESGGMTAYFFIREVLFVWPDVFHVVLDRSEVSVRPCTSREE